MYLENGQGYPQDGFKRASKSEIRDALTMYLQNTFKVQVTKTHVIEETPDTCMHACLQSGVVKLNREVFIYSDVKVPYYFCRNCGKLRVYLDFD